MTNNATFHGFVETTTDALLLFEACRRGILPKTSRRLQESERGAIKSGTVFIFDEKESGIKRWTDGLVWSPSRILGNFLLYRELGGRDSLNDNSSSRSSSYGSAEQQYNQPMLHHNHYAPMHEQQSYLQRTKHSQSSDPYYEERGAEETFKLDRERERTLVGSLTDTHKYKKDGLIKKTLSIQLNGYTQHMISYYSKEDVLRYKLSTPTSIPAIYNLQISSGLLLKQSFRVPPSVECADIVMKRPSLSPSSRSTSTVLSSSASYSNKLKRMYSAGNMNPSYQTYDQRPYYEHESAIQELSPKRTFTMMEAEHERNDHGHTRRPSYQSMEVSPKATFQHVDFQPKVDDQYSYQNRGKIQRRHSNNSVPTMNPVTQHTGKRQNSCHLPPTHNQRIYDTALLSSSPPQQQSYSASLPQKQQHFASSSSPILSPSRYLWSPHENDTIAVPTPKRLSYHPTLKQEYTLGLQSNPMDTSLHRCFDHRITSPNSTPIDPYFFQ